MTSFMEALRSPGAMVSGSPIERLQQGWGKAAFQGDKPHFWTLDTNPPEACERICEHGRIDYYVSACGLSAVINRKRRPMFGPGSFPPCKRCLRKHPGPTKFEARLAIDDLPDPMP